MSGWLRGRSPSAGCSSSTAAGASARSAATTSASRPWRRTSSSVGAHPWGRLRPRRYVMPADPRPRVPQPVLPRLGRLPLLELRVPALPLDRAPLLVGPERCRPARGLPPSQEGAQRQALLLARPLDGLRPVEVPHQQRAAAVLGRLDAGHPVPLDVGEEPGRDQRGQEGRGHPAAGPAGGHAARAAVLGAQQLTGRGPPDGVRVPGGPPQALRLLLLPVLLPVVDGRGRDLELLGGGVRGRQLLPGGLAHREGCGGGRRGQAVMRPRRRRGAGVGSPCLPDRPGAWRRAARPPGRRRCRWLRPG